MIAIDTQILGKSSLVHARRFVKRGCSDGIPCLGVSIASWEIGENMHLRELQHTPGRYSRHPQTPKRKEFLHKLLVGGLGYIPGVCWRILEM